MDTKVFVHSLRNVPRRLNFDLTFIVQFSARFFGVKRTFFVDIFVFFGLLRAPFLYDDRNVAPFSLLIGWLIGTGRHNCVDHCNVKQNRTRPFGYF